MYSSLLFPEQNGEFSCSTKASSSCKVQQESMQRSSGSASTGSKQTDFFVLFPLAQYTLYSAVFSSALMAAMVIAESPFVSSSGSCSSLAVGTQSVHFICDLHTEIGHNSSKDWLFTLSLPSILCKS